MPFTITLILGLAGAIFISGLAASMLRTASAELPPDTRDRIFSGENARANIWRAAEWMGFALMIIGQFFPRVLGLTKQSQQIYCIAAGIGLFCLANALAAWSSYAIYRKEAPETNATRTAIRGAALVSIAEIALLLVVFWIVSSRLGWMKPSRPGTSSGGTTEVVEEDKTQWLDESAALIELANHDRDYINGLAEGGSLRTKMVDGKRKYHPDDVARLKKQKPDVIP